ncbi:hypothetical protein BIV57_01430 [Mangrovactinospora gilvigrisea]|uniref:DUF2330 domain-containing protein n=1 Tax=Mangrovactinospora gilvigrisea TaxID=1428644 RepID=A0A1J7BKR3_9ACTN|nr:DUF2330 domain-containing protein [Mangrovactinospora gilvigrisea]OIV39263.1 hypothetical protein BIV57_01430 [Mangrovactinospora gilvigrisea]
MPRTHRHRLLRAALTLALLTAALVTGGLANPAWACGCGALVPGPGRVISVAQETSAVAWNGRREEIVMELNVNGTAPDAGWIMPTPSTATVSLGDDALFGALQQASEPQYRTRHYFWPRSGADWPFGLGGGDDMASGSAAAAPRPVSVLSRQKLGPFEVTRLAATDSTALQNWLTRNGYSESPRLAQGLKPYVARHWQYVAIRLAPKADGSTLDGGLTPLRIGFASRELIYPMRLSSLASSTQTLRLYLLTPHRMTPGALGGGTATTAFAGRLNASDLPAGTVTAPDRPFLTTLDQVIPQPWRIKDDLHFRQASADTPYRQTIYTDRLLEFAGLPAWFVVLGGAALLGGALAVTVGALYLARRSRRRIRV